MEGKEEGRAEGKAEIVRGMIERGMDMATIADITGIPMEALIALVSKSSIGD